MRVSACAKFRHVYSGTHRMFALLKARLGGAFKTKIGIALFGALVVGGGGTAMAWQHRTGSSSRPW